MPFVRISLKTGKSSEYLKNISESVHESLVNIFGIPELDKFQVIYEVEASNIIFAKNDLIYLNTPTGNIGFFTGFLLGIMVGAVIGALGGMMDQGSMLILMPSGPLFWAIVGAFIGSIVGALYGAFSGSSSQDVNSL